MQVTEELLRKHLLGLCTEEERKAIKEWFLQSENASSGLKVLRVDDVEKKEIWSIIQELSPALKASHSSTKVIPLYRKVIRYAAAVSIIIFSFFGGRLSVDTAHANVAIEEAPKDMLYLQGAYGAEGSIPGEEFNVRVDGVIKLTNGSTSIKTIFVGDTSFVLQPEHAYYLSRTTECPVLSNANINGLEFFHDIELEGGFSIIKRID